MISWLCCIYSITRKFMDDGKWMCNGYVMVSNFSTMGSKINCFLLFHFFLDAVMCIFTVPNRVELFLYCFQVNIFLWKRLYVFVLAHICNWFRWTRHPTQLCRLHSPITQIIGCKWMVMWYTVWYIKLTVHNLWF